MKEIAASLLPLHDNESYRYLLLDPLRQVSPDSPLHLRELEAALGQEALTRVLRLDLAHSPSHFPVLVQLAAPGEPLQQSQFNASMTRVGLEAAYERRYLCGWLASPHSPDQIATLLVTRSRQLGLALGDHKVLPFYEPLRLELLHHAYGLAGTLWPITHWWYPSASGKLHHLQGSADGHEWAMDSGMVRIQSDMAQVQALLFAWQRAAPHSPLPDDAARRAAEAWVWASDRVNHPHDRFTLALVGLNSGDDYRTSPALVQLVQQVKRHPAHRIQPVLDALSQEK